MDTLNFKIKCQLITEFISFKIRCILRTHIYKTNHYKSAKSIEHAFVEDQTKWKKNPQELNMFYYSNICTFRAI